MDLPGAFPERPGSEGVGCPDSVVAFVPCPFQDSGDRGACTVLGVCGGGGGGCCDHGVPGICVRSHLTVFRHVLTPAGEALLPSAHPSLTQVLVLPGLEGCESAGRRHGLGSSWPGAQHFLVTNWEPPPPPSQAPAPMPGQKVPLFSDTGTNQLMPWPSRMWFRAAPSCPQAPAAALPRPWGWGSDLPTSGCFLVLEGDRTPQSQCPASLADRRAVREPRVRPGPGAGTQPGRAGSPPRAPALFTPRQSLGLLSVEEQGGAGPPFQPWPRP